MVTNFRPLNSVELYCGVDIRNNENLNNIEGFDLKDGDCFGDIFILNNPKLSVCAVPYVCDFLEYLANEPNTISEISNNGSNCESMSAVETLCAAVEPSNDDCENPFMVSLDVPFTLNFDGSTASQIIPTCEVLADYFAKDVWVSFNTGTTTQLSIILPNQMKFQFWSGDCDNLLPLDDACNQGSLANLDVEPNTDYSIQFWVDAVLSRAAGPDYEITLTSEQTLSLENYHLDQLAVVPNPTTNGIHIKNLNTSLIQSVELFSIEGKQVLTTKENYIDLSNFDAGLYLLKITDSSNKSKIKKVVKL